MKTKFFALLACIVMSFVSNAQEVDSLEMLMNSLDTMYKFEHGQILLSDGGGTLSVPNGYKYLNQKQSQEVLTQLWGNPEDPTVLGMIFPENLGVFDLNTWAFVVSYEGMGYVEDDDAGDIDYEEMMKEMKGEMEAANQERVKMGYGKVDLIGWASQPYYDQNAKVLHWSKELHFDGEEGNTLNYDVRVLGRKGLYSMNAVAGMGDLENVKNAIPAMVSSIQFASGETYADFNPDVDEVAAWTIGGLVAGKVLAKVGFFAMILKFWKIILVGLGAIGVGVRKWFLRKKEAEEEQPTALPE